MVHADTQLPWQQRRATRARRCLHFACALAAITLSGCRTEPAAQTQPLELRAPTLSEVLLDLPHDRPIPVGLETDLGTLHCKLDPTRTPHAVALFLGLATGRATFLDPTTRKLTRRPLYRDLTFHRAVPELLIQSGDPVGDASGNPGYRIAVEQAADDLERLSQPGALVLARYTPPPGREDPHPPPAGLVLGSQFAVLLAAMPHLLGQLSVLGSCRDLELARRIARDVASKHAHRLRRVLTP